MDYEKAILEIIDNDEEHFFAPEFERLFDEKHYDRKAIITACYNLVKKGILRKRNCVGLAFERV